MSRLSLAVLAPLALAAAGAHAAPAAGPGPVTAAPSPPPAPAPKAPADAKRMVATTFTNMVVYENGAGYLHAFWRTLGTAGPDLPARLQWGRGCPEISDRVFTAIHTAFSNPGSFFLIVEKAPDARQAGAYCVTSVEVERINPPQPPPPAPPAPPPSIAPAPK
jgi:hypothetical protein